MGANQELARIFKQMATGLELTGANRFRVNAHQRVARLLKDMTRDVQDIVAEDEAKAVKNLSALQGVGKGTAQKMVEYLETGEVAEHLELLEQVPKGLFDVLEIPGLGPKLVKLMWEELGVTSVAELKDRLDSPELLELPLMGQKKVDNIRKAIEFSEKSGDRTPLGRARPIALEIEAELKAVDGGGAGAVRGQPAAGTGRPSATWISWCLARTPRRCGWRLPKGRR